MPTATAIDPQLGVVEADREFWATSIVAGKKKLRGVSAIRTIDLAKAITSIKPTDTILGSSTIVVTLKDQGWVINDTGFFDADADGRIDPIEVNYPAGSELWWRLMQVGVDSTRGGATLTLTFLERAAAYLMAHHGPLKISRAKRTRAEFLKMLHDKVKAGGGITFHTSLLKVKQKQADLTAAEEKAKEKSDREKRKDKDKGISRDEKITFVSHDGTSYTLKPGEIRNAERVLDEAVKHTTNHKVLLALCEACIVEAPFFRNPMGGDSSSVGILQLLDIFGSVSKRRDIAWVVKQFLLKGFAHYDGAIKAAKAHPEFSAGQLAQWVQGSAYPDRYDAVKDGAEQVINAYGGSSDGGHEYRKQYNFEVGTTSKPHEDFWEAINRLATEVKWAYFLDGDDAYYDPETELIKQKPVAVIHRDDPAVVRFTSNWDGRHIATEATLVLVCDPFEFRAGEVFKLAGFGPASSGSTAGFPGRWLIQDIDRDDIHDLVATITLKQPEDPAPEPRSPTATSQDKEDGSGGPGEVLASKITAAQLRGKTPAEIINLYVLPVGRKAGAHAPSGATLTRASNTAANHQHSHLGSASDHAGPPDYKWAADLSIGPDVRYGNKKGAKIGDEIAEALAKIFGISWPRHGGLVSAEHHGFRFQLIWRYEDPQAGNHYTHVHFGVRRTVGGITKDALSGL